MSESKQKLFKDFDVATVQDWENAAREELKGADPWTKLKYDGPGFTQLPYYHKNQTPRDRPLLRASENQHHGARSWFNCPLVVVSDESSANKTALNHLTQGAEGILFELDTSPNFEALLNEIQPDYCSLNFLVNGNLPDLSPGLTRWFSKNKSRQSVMPGAMFGQQGATAHELSSYRLHGIVLTDRNSADEEIANAFGTLISATAPQLSQTAFSITLGSDFFADVARIRAIRIVWNHFLQQRKIKQDHDLFIHARIKSLSEGEYEPNGNVIHLTTGAIAAIWGGCDAFTADPEDPSDEANVRVARNVSNLLREESYFSITADPVAGSFLVESLVEQIVEKALKRLNLNR